MPDFNPAIAAQIQPPQAVQQPNLMQTLSQAAEIQRSQAQTSLAQVQALQQTRQYNALLAASQAYQHGSDPVGAYLGGGGNPEGASQLQNLFLQQKAAAATPGGLAPQAYEQLSGAQKNQAETANARAQLPGFQAKSAQSDMEFRGGVANSLAADTSDDNWKAQVPQLVGHVSPGGMAQIMDAYKNPDKRAQVAKNMIAAALPPSDATKLETTTGGQGVTSPLERLSAPVGNTQATPQAGQAQAPQAGQQSGLLGGRPAPSVGAVKTQELDAAQYSKVLSGLQAQANTSASQLPHIQMAKALINSPDFYSGTAEGPVLGYKRLLAATGIDPGASLPQEAFRKTMAANILHQVDDLKASAQEMGSSTSRIFGSQIELMEKAAQNPDNSIAANRFLTELSSRAAQRNMTIGDMAADYKQQHGSLDVGFEKSLRNWMTKNPMFSPKELANPSLIGAAPPFKEGATATNPQTKAKMTFTNGQWQ